MISSLLNVSHKILKSVPHLALSAQTMLIFLPITFLKALTSHAGDNLSQVG